MLPHLHYSPPLPPRHAPGAEPDDGRAPRCAPAVGSGILAFLLVGSADGAPPVAPALRAGGAARAARQVPGRPAP
jgi:hypothetical protein